MTATLNSLITIAATEGGGHAEEEPSGLDLILPEPAELIWGAVAFLIVLLVLTKVAFPRLRASIEEREQKIKESLEAADRAKAESSHQQEEYKKQLAEARSEANRIIEEARQQAEQVRKELTEKAQKEAEQIVARAQDQIDAERSRTVQELQGTIADLSIELAEKVVGRSLDDRSQREMVDAYIREVGGMNGGGSNK
ncbi:MAG: F0F1 ATP synthase subunit B [Actinomycetota bacterium]|nr:F0F1 ATP synthase subunit B [Actinomycetota bacterium]